MLHTVVISKADEQRSGLQCQSLVQWGWGGGGEWGEVEERSGGGQKALESLP